MFRKINILSILSDHYRTLSRKDYITFIILPIAIGTVTYHLFGDINSGYASALLAAFSIFASLLLNLEVIVFGYLDRIRSTRSLAKGTFDQHEIAISERRHDLLYQIFCNVSYLILISIIEIVILTFTYVQNLKLYCSPEWSERLQVTHNILIHTLAAHFILTLLMILKRFHYLLSTEAKDSGS